VSGWGTRTKAKLSVEDVADIKRALLAGDAPLELAGKYAVHLSSIYNIATGACWAGVQVEGWHPDSRPTHYRKLRASQVSEMRRIYRRGGVIFETLAQQFGVSTATARRAVRRIYYAWV
jgi:hypothetical protein